MGELVPYLLGLAGVVITAVVTVYGQKLLRKTNKVTENLTERRDTIADRDSIIDGFRTDLTAVRSEMASQRTEISALRAEIENVRDHNNALITYCYKLIAILRHNGLADDLPTPPPNGIHI